MPFTLIVSKKIFILSKWEQKKPILSKVSVVFKEPVLGIKPNDGFITLAEDEA